MEKPKPKNVKNQPAKPATAPAPKATPAAPAPGPVPPLFRRIDWLALAFTFAVVWIVYFLTLAPELTLEDSGELCTGSYYAGIPHPPGYPFWAIYSWFWTVILPFKNIAWRVEVGEATAEAMACGLIAFVVSRGSSLLMEGIEELKGITGKWENIICVVSGIVAGLLMGFGSVMWSESVAINRISLFGVPWVMMVLLCLLRWMYAPHQLRYLFCAMFFFGICFTIHQTLLCAAVGIEAAVTFAMPRIGRGFWLGNSVIYILIWIARVAGLVSFLDSPTLMIIFNVIGVVSIFGYIVLTVVTKESYPEVVRDAALAGFLLFCSLAVLKSPAFWVLGLACAGVFLKFAYDTWKIGREWLIAIACGMLWFAGTLFYLYEPLAGMTDPPMQWGYPRTVEGFIHALSRGQYEKPNPTNVMGDPGRFIVQLGMLIGDIAGEFNWVVLFVALVPLLFLFKMQKRERAWIAGLVVLYLFMGVFLMILMNPSPDRQSADLIKVFFASSHTVVAVLFGYGLALVTAFMATHYQRFRVMALVLGTVGLLPALLAFYNGVAHTFYGNAGTMEPKAPLFLFLSLAGCLVLSALAVQSYIKIFHRAADAPAPETESWVLLSFAFGALICLVVSAFIAFFHADHLTISQVTGVLPRLFAPHQFYLPVLAGLLILGISAAFIVSLLAYRDRAPLAITLALFGLMPISSVLSHWAAAEQRDHWFGYWFGHDMFTPPFEALDGTFSYDAAERAKAMKGPKAKIVYPEMDRNTILFGGTDPGRFCPTYMIFCESFIPHSCQPEMDQHFDRRDVYIITQNALADNTYLQYIRAHYFRSDEYKYDSPFFQELLRSSKEREENYKTNFLARTAYKLLDRPFTDLGAKIEARRRAEGVYPPKEIYTPTPEDSQRCFQEYMADAQQRLLHDREYPNEPPQIRPGEDVHVDPNSSPPRVQVSGQIAVMAINGLLTKVIFEHNPTNEFYVEESFPLDWMYPHLTPYGVIMKINRNPLPELTDEICQRDHEFWSKYSERFIGNWLTYDTPVKEIAAFVEKVYLQHDYSGFKGDLRFIRDEEAQKAFSKLRSSIGGVYAWRLGMSSSSPTPPQYLPKTEVERQRMLREADFAFRQSFAFCPFSPEAVYRYIQLLANVGRLEDAAIVAETCYKLDPYNGQIKDLVGKLRAAREQNGHVSTPAPTATAQIAELENEVRSNPNDFQKALTLASHYSQMHQQDRAEQLLEGILSNSNVDQTAVLVVAQAFAQMNNLPKLEMTLQQLVKMAPTQPEAWYNLAKVQAVLGKSPEALQSLGKALALNSARLEREPNTLDLRSNASKDIQFASMRSLPQFQALIATNRH
jgi:thioredoxin-like negative regulator of GroEL